VGLLCGFGGAKSVDLISGFGAQNYEIKFKFKIYYFLDINKNFDGFRGSLEDNCFG
jgi:hypothetical protein